MPVFRKAPIISNLVRNKPLFFGILFSKCHIMEQSRRNFMHRFSQQLGGLALLPFFQTKAGDAFMDAIIDHSQRPISTSIKDETFWYQIKQAYTVSSSLLNLNNGGVSPQPKVVQQAVERYNQLSNETPSYYMWRTLDQGREPIRQKLAQLAGCDPECLAINRNTTEALETVIFGLPLNPNDEVVLTKQDYPNMINAWKQRQKRDGIILKWLSFDFPSTDEDAIVQKFVSAFSSKTKVVHITHMINWNGQVLPVRRIADAAKDRGIEVLVDGAHTFAHLDYTIADLNCDYFGTSLHKWLCAPFGSGMLYVSKEKIAPVYPLFAAPQPDSADIRKFEHLGTRSFAIEQGIGQAIDFHDMIGSKRKAQRLHFLKNYWAEACSSFPGVSVATPLEPAWSGAIGLLQIEGKTPQEVSSFLFKKFKIHTVAINWENIHGVRITPNVYTTTNDLDRLINGIKALLSS